jgi:hypothetical protein
MGNEARSVIYRMRVSVPGTNPLIWRLIQVPGIMPLHTLHTVLQIVMGWENYHLYEFIMAGAEYSDPGLGWEEDDITMRDSKRVRVEELVSAVGESFTYVYDLGDNWQHELVVEEIVPTKATVRTALCLDGAYAPLPEDCGGIHGYAEMLEVLGDPTDREEDYETWVTWLGDRIDRETFDLDKVNGQLRRIRVGKRR